MGGIIALLGVSGAHADAVTKVIDTGPGLATVTRFPNGDIMVYDTGHWNHDADVFLAFRKFIGDSDVDLLITSHSDSDHLAATDELFAEYRVHRVIRTGLVRDTDTWEDHNDAIEAAAADGLTHDVNLAKVTLPHGTTYDFGEAMVTYLAGFHEPPDEWGLSGSEFRNGNSIVMRVEYRGNSVLLTGDAVGREEGRPAETAAIATERYLIDNAEARPIASTVLIAPHHGSDDANSTEFIRAVGATYVIFPAGHDHEHPRRETAERYLSVGYQPGCLLRTDLGDEEGGDEWSFAALPGESDPIGDNSVDIILRDDGSVAVGYEGVDPAVCTPIADSRTPVVKKSRSGICHTDESPWYDRTIYFEAFDSVEACVASGGRAL